MGKNGPSPDECLAGTGHKGELFGFAAGDEGEVFRRLEAEIRRNPSLDEREAYRRAVRTWFLEARGGTHGTIGEGVEDVWL